MEARTWPQASTQEAQEEASGGSWSFWEAERSDRAPGPEEQPTKLLKATHKRKITLFGSCGL